jgi:hypothetical protein
MLIFYIFLGKYRLIMYNAGVTTQRLALDTGEVPASFL